MWYPNTILTPLTQHSLTQILVFFVASSVSILDYTSQHSVLRASYPQHGFFGDDCWQFSHWLWLFNTTGPDFELCLVWRWDNLLLVRSWRNAVTSRMSGEGKLLDFFFFWIRATHCDMSSSLGWNASYIGLIAQHEWDELNSFTSHCFWHGQIFIIHPSGTRN